MILDKTKYEIDPNYDFKYKVSDILWLGSELEYKLDNNIKLTKEEVDQFYNKEYYINPNDNQNIENNIKKNKKNKKYFDDIIDITPKYNKSDFIDITNVSNNQKEIECNNNDIIHITEDFDDDDYNNLWIKPKVIKNVHSDHKNNKPLYKKEISNDYNLNMVNNNIKYKEYDNFSQSKNISSNVYSNDKSNVNNYKSNVNKNVKYISKNRDENRKIIDNDENYIPKKKSLYKYKQIDNG